MPGLESLCKKLQENAKKLKINFVKKESNVSPTIYQLFLQSLPNPITVPSLRRVLER